MIIERGHEDLAPMVVLLLKPKTGPGERTVHTLHRETRRRNKQNSVPGYAKHPAINYAGSLAQTTETRQQRRAEARDIAKARATLMKRATVQIRKRNLKERRARRAEELLS